jgi:hypothetical protein
MEGWGDQARHYWNSQVGGNDITIRRNVLACAAGQIEKPMSVPRQPSHDQAEVVNRKYFVTSTLEFHWYSLTSLLLPTTKRSDPSGSQSTWRRRDVCILVWPGII